MMIDLSTAASLELIQNLQNAKSRDCLFGLLNETLTPMGARLLRSNILQPPIELEKINARYDAVEELSTKEDMFYAIREGWLRTAPLVIADEAKYHSSEELCRRRQSSNFGR
jgi:DNA mismatch repair protein MSH4